uniref:Uncharacterized protein n=1 Tax=Lotus japonicus TaxID=34305 RepID=I3SN46_LOTJA|nr:unknown [Lotus japonicus]
MTPQKATTGLTQTNIATCFFPCFPE